MATAQGTIRDNTSTGTSSSSLTTTDRAEEMLRSFDQTTQESTGISLLHILTLGSIGASLALFFAGKKQSAIFVGLWPPTFQALKAAVDTKKNKR